MSFDHPLDIESFYAWRLRSEQISVRCKFTEITAISPQRRPPRCFLQLFPVSVWFYIRVYSYGYSVHLCETVNKWTVETHFQESGICVIIHKWGNHAGKHYGSKAQFPCYLYVNKFPYKIMHTWNYYFMLRHWIHRLFRFYNTTFILFNNYTSLLKDFHLH